MNAIIKLPVMAKLRIDKNVAMPSARAVEPCPYPFSDMSIRDSFFVATQNPRKTMNHIGRLKARFQSEQPGTHTYEFECRRAIGGVRCWRTK